MKKNLLYAFLCFVEYIFWEFKKNTFIKIWHLNHTFGALSKPLTTSNLTYNKIHRKILNNLGCFYPCLENNKLRHMTIWRGWSGGAMVLGKLPVLGRPTNLD